ncbi:hypothetical protein Mapa_016212 [Marchantia paleacea]|nr:hypothetical protein Mapa_016212 [Marchantia paleacea]
MNLDVDASTEWLKGLPRPPNARSCSSSENKFLNSAGSFRHQALIVSVAHKETYRRALTSCPSFRLRSFRYAIPVSSSSGHEVLWKAVNPKETGTRPMAANSQLGLDRSADIQAVRELNLPEGCSSQSNDKKGNVVKKKPKTDVKHKQHSDRMSMDS